MMDFAQTIKAQVDKALGKSEPWGDVNPLVVIGLTEAILDLGLNQDQIYAVIRSYGRQLAAQVHPDTQQTNVSPERQRQILGAFDILDNKENFIRALYQFRTLKAEDRRETRLLQQTLSALRDQISGYETRFEELNVGRRKLDADYQLYLRQKREDPALTPKLEEDIAGLKGQLKVEQGLAKELRKRITAEKNKADVAESKIETLERRISFINAQFPDAEMQIRKLKGQIRDQIKLTKETLKKAAKWERTSKKIERWYKNSVSTRAELYARIVKLRSELRAKKKKESGEESPKE